MEGNDDGGHHDQHQGGGGGGGGGAKKRPNDNQGDYANSPQKKGFFNGRANNAQTDPEAVYLKFMVPQATAGSVIGKGGQNISDLQKEYNVHIRMSKANDTFPGTDNRVAIMSGKVANVLTSTMVIFKRMTSPSDLFPKNPRPKTVSDKELSLIVPQATAGLIIGKGGSRVKSIQEDSNCHINLTQKNEQLPTNERVVTIQNNDANPDNIETALKLILEIIKGDPQSSSCLTINYSNSGGHSNNRDDYNEDYGDDSKSYGGGGGGGGGGGRNWRGGSGGGNNNSGNSSGPQNTPAFGTTSGYPPQVHFWCTFAGPPISNGHTPPPHMIEGMKAYLLNVGYPPKAIQEIIAAGNLLASYGILKPGNISVFNSPQLQMNPFSAMGGGNDAVSGMGNMGSMGGGGGMGGGSLDGWNNTMAGMFMKQFQQGSAARGYEDFSLSGGGGGFDSGYMSGMGGSGGAGGGMNVGGGGGYGKSDNGTDKWT
ncbi:RNA-binding protein Nova-2 isoform X2 [Folsomia candida]|uniref:RNA-binding protein Nova-2 isoform X2 n=1 Tax=Folsomia candida TaxID=158441 RepID=UPI001605472A|nr:RNA-binding protein Nova-2 isoform X2 [Folsomia candida]XP_035705622.1 RNA-binding protein Nova-2 isoform X2 [Folsomia candida]